MKYLGFLLLASAGFAQIIKTFYTDEGHIEYSTDPKGIITTRTCFVKGARVDCIGVFYGDMLGMCQGNSYNNGKKESPKGDCCRDSSDCVATCDGFACL